MVILEAARDVPLKKTRVNIKKKTATAHKLFLPEHRFNKAFSLILVS
jgi:hypothetical protein